MLPCWPRGARTCPAPMPIEQRQLRCGGEHHAAHILVATGIHAPLDIRQAFLEAVIVRRRGSEREQQGGGQYELFHDATAAFCRSSSAYWARLLCVANPRFSASCHLSAIQFQYS